MVPSIFGENMLDDFFDGGFFGALRKEREVSHED